MKILEQLKRYTNNVYLETTFRVIPFIMLYLLAFEVFGLYPQFGRYVSNTIDGFLLGNLLVSIIIVFLKKDYQKRMAFDTLVVLFMFLKFISLLIYLIFVYGDGYGWFYFVILLLCIIIYFPISLRMIDEWQLWVFKYKKGK